MGIKAVKSAILVFVVNLAVLHIHAADETKSVRVNNPKVNTSLIVMDDKWYAPGPIPYNVPWYDAYQTCNSSSQAIFEFGFDETMKIYHGQPFSTTITFDVIGYDKNNSPTAINNINLTITYDPAKTTTYIDKNAYVMNDIYFMDVTVRNISTVSNGQPAPNPVDLYIEGRIRSKRDYELQQFTAWTVTTINKSYLPVSKELEVHWPHVRGAESYDLEWCWSNSYNSAQPVYNFRYNATRVRTGKNYFRIPMVYEAGTIAYRVRPVGKACAFPGLVVEGRWSNELLNLPDNGLCSSLPGNFTYATGSFEADAFNWASSFSFDEHGRIGASVALNDALMKPHYELTKINDENNVVASSTLYDYQGRPAIQVLPAPMQKYALEYTANLNRSASGANFDKAVFDKDVALSPCAMPSAPMNVLSNGAAAYYSSQNGLWSLQSDKESQQAFLPDAGLYPYLRTDYTPDATGRIRGQSSPGEMHRPGGGKDVKYFYSNPGDQEVDRLFGSEAGAVNHYSKNSTLDANGQLSVSYVDNKGRVVATALAGNKPPQLQALPDYSNPTAALTEHLTQRNVSSPYEIKVSSSILIASANDVQQFLYEFTPEDISMECFGAGICLNCIYELELSIKDECGTELVDLDPGTPFLKETALLVGNVANPQPCSTSVKFSLPAPVINITFPSVGNYYVTKTLRVSDVNVEKYWEIYKQNCLKSLSDFEEDLLSEIDLSQCNGSCAQCSTAVNAFDAAHPGVLSPAKKTAMLKECGFGCTPSDPCDGYRQQMLRDLTPSTDPGQAGQYAGGTYGTALSIFGGANSLVNYSSLVFHDDEGNVATVVNSSGVSVAPNTLSEADFKALFQPSWAMDLLPYHPEYCYLEFCQTNSTSILYDQAMLEVNTFDEACSLGYLRPLSVTPLSNSCIGGQNCAVAACATNNYDPFFITGSGASIVNTMKSEITSNYNNDASLRVSPSSGAWLNALIPQGVTLPTVSNGPAGVCAYYLASQMVNTSFNAANYCFGSSSCEKDREWRMFRALYLSKKAKVYEKLERENALAKGCLNECIGTSSPLFTYSSTQPCVATPPNRNANCGSQYNAYNDPKATCSSALASSYSTKVRVFTNILNLATAGPQALANASSGGNAPNPVLSSQADGYLNTCTAYAQVWMQKLVECGAILVSSPSYNSIRNNLIAVCAYGSDNNNPLGVSAIVNGGTHYTGSPSSVINFPTSYNYASPGSHFNTFQEVLNAYGVTSAFCTDAIINGFPLPQGQAGTMATSKNISYCACTQVMNNEAEFLSLQANNTLPQGVTTPAQLWAYYVVNYSPATQRPPLGNYAELACVCSREYQNNLGQDQSAVWDQFTSWYNNAQMSAIAAYRIEVPAELSCCLQANTAPPLLLGNFASGGNLKVANGAFNALGIAPGTDGYDYARTTYLNNTLHLDFGPEKYSRLLDVVNSFSTTGIGTSTLPIASKGLQNFLNERLAAGVLVTTHTLNPLVAPSLLIDRVYSGPFLPGDVITYSAAVTGNTLDIRLSSHDNPGFRRFIQLTIPSAAAFHFSDVLSFNNLFHYSTAGHLGDLKCEIVLNPAVAALTTPSLAYVLVSANVNNSGDEEVTALLTQEEFPLIFQACNVIEQQEDPCSLTLLEQAHDNAASLYQQQLGMSKELFVKTYKTACMQVDDERFERSYNLREYNYTLYYYDQADNLIRTVPPAGVNPITGPSNFAAIAAYRATGAGSPVFPAHEYPSNYKHSSYNSVLASLSPDVDNETSFAYDAGNRIIASQDARQKAQGTGVFSYSLFDELGRLIESGQVNDPGANFSTITNLGSGASYPSWNNAIAVLNRNQVTRTTYDMPAPSVQQFFNGGQFNLRNRVSSVSFFETLSAGVRCATYFSYDVQGNVSQVIQQNMDLLGVGQHLKSMEYEYDLLSGNVNRVIYQRGWPDQLIHLYFYDADNRIKEVLSTRDEVHYDRDAKYFYYKHGALARTELGQNKINGLDYAYTIHGWLKGMNSAVLGPERDMGKDGRFNADYNAGKPQLHGIFAKDASGYTLNYYTSAASNTLKDYYGVRSQSQYQFTANEANIRTNSVANFDLLVSAPDLYNGNIASMVTSYLNQNPNSTVPVDAYAPQISAYRYDQLNRLERVSTYRDLNVNPASPNFNSWATPSGNDQSFYQRFWYDDNGNITAATKNGGSAAVASNLAGLPMDDLAYGYGFSQAPLSGRKNNRLLGVSDAVVSGYTNDSKQNVTPNPLDPTKASWNYDYDASGNMVMDRSEHIANILWTVDGKVSAVIRDNLARPDGTFPPNLEFGYDASRRRHVKIVKPRTSGSLPSPQYNWQYTYYVYDASGQVMGTYNKSYEVMGVNTYREKMRLNELNLYGSQRLGTQQADYETYGKPFTAGIGFDGAFINVVPQNLFFTVLPTNQQQPHALGRKTFELSNHLGNVLATISDRKLQATNTGVGACAISLDMNGSMPAEVSNINSGSSSISGGKLVVANNGLIPLQGVAIKVGNNLSPTTLYRLDFDFDPGNLVPANCFYLVLVERNTSTGVILNSTILITSFSVPSLGHYTYTYTPVNSGPNVDVFANFQAWQNGCFFRLDNVSLCQESYVVDYNPDILSHTDYYAFGQQMPGRTWVSSSYRYGMNGQEKDDEIFSGAYTAEYWEYDSRIGRRWNIDPVIKSWESPYACFNNNPIYYADPSGLDGEGPNGECPGDKKVITAKDGHVSTYEYIDNTIGWRGQGMEASLGEVEITPMPGFVDSPNQVDNYIADQGIDNFAPKKVDIPDGSMQWEKDFAQYNFEVETDRWNKLSYEEKWREAYANIYREGAHDWIKKNYAEPLAELYTIEAELGGSGMASGTRVVITKATSEIIEAEVQVVESTLHGATRVEGASATRGGVLSLEGVNATKKLGTSFAQADGATVYLHEVSPGKFNAVVEGSKGIITTMKGWSKKSIDRIAKNYGWNLK